MKGFHLSSVDTTRRGGRFNVNTRRQCPLPKNLTARTHHNLQITLVACGAVQPGISFPTFWRRR
jgi:hypothetical protein